MIKDRSGSGRVPADLPFTSFSRRFKLAELSLAFFNPMKEVADGYLKDGQVFIDSLFNPVELSGILSQDGFIGH